ncbi:hypothetical protein [Algoriphagus sp. CAU 1675]|uniref:hypothetical protein n=1 Tax=Algoriphagus sp. CAU 1675 TaxID=3032597 RepID=UPI0023DAD32D|nr:hypothetical protein [Algoriphagus sp. CAU 1675]MDF2156597.1 hypothetical protein [Algoriphagus sp. CAU 1675]
MNTTEEVLIQSGTNRLVFFKNASIAILFLSIFFAFGGKFSPETSRWFAWSFLFTPLAAGIAGIIFRNTEDLRGSKGSKKALGWTIGLTAYLVMIPLGLLLGLNGPN